MNRDLLELYSDHLLSIHGKATATNLSRLMDGACSHDQVTRLPSRNHFTGKTLWGLVKPTVRQAEDDSGVLILGDTVEEKPYL